jgi:hypothetical protein
MSALLFGRKHTYGNFVDRNTLYGLTSDVLRMGVVLAGQQQHSSGSNSVPSVDHPERKPA